jgi:hypothetical protein
MIAPDPELLLDGPWRRPSRSLSKRGDSQKPTEQGEEQRHLFRLCHTDTPNLGDDPQPSGAAGGNFTVFNGNALARAGARRAILSGELME